MYLHSVSYRLIYEQHIFDSSVYHFSSHHPNGTTIFSKGLLRPGIIYETFKFSVSNQKKLLLSIESWLLNWIGILKMVYYNPQYNPQPKY